MEGSIKIIDGMLVIDLTTHSNSSHYINMHYFIIDNSVLCIEAERVNYGFYSDAFNFSSKYNIDEIESEYLIEHKPWFGKPYKAPREGYYRLKKVTPTTFKSSNFTIIENGNN
jgi:hypothetical protein